MASQVAEERFDWQGPAVGGRNRGGLWKRFSTLFVPPKGQKVIPTGSGMLLVFIGLTIGLAAYNTENNILFAALSLLIASLVLSGIICWGNFQSARWRLETSSTFRVGEEGNATIVVENAKRRFPLFCIWFRLSSEAVEKDQRLYLKDRLDPGESTRLVWRFRPEKRSASSLVINEAASSFPFGFLSKHLPGNSSVDITVWPRRISYQKLTNTGVPGIVFGKSSRKKGESGELIGLRQYAQGDPLRSIHWKVSAKQRRLFVKESALEGQPLFSLFVDPSEYLWPSEECFEKMASLAATIAEDLFLAGKLDKCRIAGSDTIRIQRVIDLEAFLDGLAALDPVSGFDRDQSLSRALTFRAVSENGVGVFIDGIQIAQA